MNLYFSPCIFGLVAPEDVNLLHLFFLAYILRLIYLLPLSTNCVLHFTNFTKYVKKWIFRPFFKYLRVFKISLPYCYTFPRVFHTKVNQKSWFSLRPTVYPIFMLQRLLGKTSIRKFSKFICIRQNVVHFTDIVYFV